MRRTARKLHQLTLLAGLLVVGRHAAAHGGTWRADQVLVEPGNESHVIVHSDVWGMVETRDAGHSWHWTCAEAAYHDSLSVLRRPIVLLPGGTLLVGIGRSAVTTDAAPNIARSADSLCNFEQVSFSGADLCGGDCLTFDVAPDAPGTPSALALTTRNNNGQYDNRLFRTTDAGATWVNLQSPLPQDVVASGVRVAPSDATTMYVAAVTVTAPQMPLLLRSKDSGATWERTSLPPPSDPSARLWVRDVHPQDPNVVFIWFDAEAGTAIAPDRLLVSADGGLTFPIAFDAANDLPGLTFAPDGTVFLGGTNDGLWSASLDDIRAGAADAFHQVDTGPTWGLAWIEQGLLAGREEYVAQPDEPRMSLGLSCDLGVTFLPTMLLCDVTLAQCTPGTSAGDTCSSLYYGDLNFEADFVKARACDSASDFRTMTCDGGNGGRDAGNGGADSGGRAGETSVEGGGCGCRTAPGMPSDRARWTLLSLCALPLTRRRRPVGSSSPGARSPKPEARRSHGRRG